MDERRQNSRRPHSNHNPRSGWSRKSSANRCLSAQRASNKKKKSDNNKSKNSSLSRKKKAATTRPTTIATTKETITENSRRKQQLEQRCADSNMEVEEMPLLRSSSLKGGREEEMEDRPTKKKRDERDRMDGVMEKSRSQSVPSVADESEDIIPKSMILPSSPTRATSPTPTTSSLISTYTPLLHPLLPAPPGQGEEEKVFPQIVNNKMDRNDYYHLRLPLSTSLHA